MNETTPWQELADKLKSRKFWFALLAALLPLVLQAVTGEVGWDVALGGSLTVVVAYIFGQGYVDGKAAESDAIVTTALLQASQDAQPADDEG